MRMAHGRMHVRCAATGGAPAEVWQPQEAQELIKKGYKYVDVRTPEEFAAGRVPKSVNLPLGPNLAKQFKDMFPNVENAKIVMACQAGNRSTTALQLLAANGIPVGTIVNYRGGWSAWAQSGLPVEK